MTGTVQFSSAKDKNSIDGDMTCYKVVKEIWKFDYRPFRIPIFKYDWVESNNGIKVDKLGFTYVNLSKISYKNYPFMLASQSNQVFYVDVLMKSGWSTTLSAEPRNISPDNNQNQVKTLEELNITNKELVEIDDLEGLIGSYARKDNDDVWIKNNWVRILQGFF